MKKFLFSLKMEWLYSILMLIFGIQLVFLTPPFQVPDEVNHFLRVYQISEGYLRSPIGEVETPESKKFYPYAEIPVDFQHLLSPGHEGIVAEKNYYGFSHTLKMFSIPVNSDTRSGYLFIPNTGLYSPLVYAPQAFMSFLAEKLFGTVGAVFYFARLGTLIFSIICIYISMKILPEKKLLIFLISFMPMFLYEMTSTSSDAIIYSIAILSTTYLLSLRKSEDLLSRKELSFMILAAISIGLAKQVYGVILLLYLLIPSERFGSKKKFYIFGLGIIVVYLVTSFTWLYLAKSGTFVSPHTLPDPNVDITKQIEFIKSNPLTFGGVIYNSIILPHLYNHCVEFIGVLGWLNKFLPHWFYIFYGILLIFGAFLGNLNLKPQHRIFMLLLSVPTLVVMVIYFYVTWTPVGNPVIQGMQGRYFIPLAVIFFSALSFEKNNSWEIIMALSAGIISSFITLLIVIEGFYL